MIGLSILLAAAVSASAPYPAQNILGAFGEICFADSTRRQSGPALAGDWTTLAEGRGWQRVISAPPLGATFTENSAARTFVWAKALNYELATSVAQGLNEGAIKQSLFRKRVAGREVYLSILGVEASNPTLAECRLRDPLGDGVSKLPVTRRDIEVFLGRSVKKGTGWYRSVEYSWSEEHRPFSLRVHFGFAGRPLGIYGGKYDPYAQYGLTLVRSDLEEIIVT